MKHKRLLILLLALCFVMSMMPATAFAAEIKAPAKIAPGTVVMGQINPMAGEMPAAVRSQSAELNAGETVTADTFHTTREAALTQLQAGMLARQDTIIIGVTNEIFSQSLVYSLPNTVYGHTGQPNAGDYLLCHWYSWGATIYQSNAGWTIVYEMTYLTTAEEEDQVDAAVDALLADLNLWNATDYEKVKGVYDWICANVAYDYSIGSISSYTAYGALINRSAVCQGYASLFYRLMLELGVDCRVITGTVEGGAHAWNIVKLDGVYYNVDPTFDAAYLQGDVGYCYFLVSDLNFLDHVPDSAYTNPDFLAAYPKAEFNYDDSNGPALFGFCGAEGTYGENLVWVLQDGILVIVGEGAMADFWDSEAPWRKYADRVVGVYVDEGVTTIGRNAFDEMINATEVYLPDTLKTIGGTAFRRWSSLQSIDLPDGLIEIGEDAFVSSGLTSIVIPDSVTVIGEGAFRSSIELKSATLPKGTTVIPDFMFQSCGKLEFVEIPDTVTTIGKDAFIGTALKSIVIPASVTYIASSPFSSTEIETIIFEGNAPEFSNDALYGVTAIAYYPAGNETWTEEVMQQYGGTITWKPACEEHAFESVVTAAPTCTESGSATHTCTVCGHSYEEYLPTAHTYTNDQDAICDVCNLVRHVDVVHPENPQTVHMFRLYDPNSGEHFYTGSADERDWLVSLGWNYEGVGFSFPVVGAPVYRLYDPATGEHLYTMDIDEVNSLILAGWNNEGIAFNSAPETEVPQYRLHNPNATRGAYHFTSSADERDWLIGLGWEYQGIGWYSCWK